MANFSVNILGCGSATPSLRHNPSAQVVDHEGRLFMIDCGEGTQLKLRHMKISFAKIKHIFISHLHGDHMLGLPGLLSTISLHDVHGQVHVYMFAEGVKWVQEFMRIARHYSTGTEVVFHPISYGREVVYEDNRLTVETIPLHHGVPCVGYLFKEKPKLRKIRGDMVEFYNVPQYQRASLKEGADFVKADGTVIPNEWLTLDPDAPLSYAYCSDTTFKQSVIDEIMGTSTIYHESTYADDKAAKARERGHSTARQAGIVAREAHAHQLILGHFSKSYLDESMMLQQASEEFPNVIVANEGMNIPIV